MWCEVGARLHWEYDKGGLRWGVTNYFEIDMLGKVQLLGFSCTLKSIVNLEDVSLGTHNGLSFHPSLNTQRTPTPLPQRKECKWIAAPN